MHLFAPERNANELHRDVIANGKYLLIHRHLHRNLDRKKRLIGNEVCQSKVCKNVRMGKKVVRNDLQELLNYPPLTQGFHRYLVLNP